MTGFWQGMYDRLRAGQDRFTGTATQADLDECLETLVVPALTEARNQFESEGYTVTLDRTESTVTLKVAKRDESFAFYAVEGRLYFYSAFAFPVLHGRKDRPRFAKLHIETNGGSHAYRCDRCTPEFLRDECIETCRKWLDW